MTDDKAASAAENHSELPSVEDRTLFLACLTCVVASAYDFDLTVEGAEDSKEENGAAPGAPVPVNPELQHEASMYLEDSEPLLNETEEEKQTLNEMEEENARVERNIERAIKIQEKMELAEQRHFVRRYKVAKDFILSSAHHLLLDQEVVTREFLPMLDTLLEDSASSETIKQSSSHSKLQQVLQNPESNAMSSFHNSLQQPKNNDKFQTYLTQLQPTPAYQCLSWLLFQHLLHSESSGYDARVRYWFKSLGVTLWVREMELDVTTTTKSGLQKATKKFESLETCCADRLLTLAAANAQNGPQEAPKRKSASLGSNIWKGVQIGGVGVGAGILLAVTGGLAAPGIAAGLAALGMGAVAGTFLSLASSAAVVSLFGVAGGSLAAYKMNRRVSGLTQFEIQQEFIGENGDGTVSEKELPTPQLFLSIALSGWLNDKSDFQRPWGVTPTNPPIQDKVELLQRFYYIHNPQLVEDAEAIWKMHKNDPDRLWKLLKYKYGADPDQNVFQTTAKEKHPDGLTDEEIKQLDQIIVAIGKVEGGEEAGAKDKPSKDADNSKATAEESNAKKDKRKSGRFSIAKWGKKDKEDGANDKDNDKDKGEVEEESENWMEKLKRRASVPSKDKDKGEEEEGSESWMDKLKRRASVSDKDKDKGDEEEGSESWMDELKQTKGKPSVSDPDTHTISNFETIEDKEDNSMFGGSEEGSEQEKKPFEPPAYLQTVWTYPKLYGGELYTVKWEADLLYDLSKTMSQLALDLGVSAGQKVLQATVAAPLVVAAAIPMAILGAMNSIDSTWTLVMERTDLAGKELARSLLVNKGGHRPVTLMGYSFGARIIYVALKELAEYQQKWEEMQLELRKKEGHGDGVIAYLKEDDKKKVVCKVGDLEFDREPASVVEDAIMMGMPKYLSLSVWKACREVVAGRLINAYSRKDKILSYMFKYKNMLGSYQPVVGTCTVAVPGVENVDVTDLVYSHGSYCSLEGKILQRLRLGQPVRSSSHALDEVALLEEAKNMVEKEEELDGRRHGEPSIEGREAADDLLRGWG